MNTDLTQTIHAGTLLVIERGSYSDRAWSDPMRVKRTMTKQEMVDLALAYFATRGKRDFDGELTEFTCEDFLPALCALGIIEDVPTVHRWHVGSYSEFKP